MIEKLINEDKELEKEVDWLTSLLMQYPEITDEGIENIAKKFNLKTGELLEDEK